MDKTTRGRRSGGNLARRPNEERPKAREDLLRPSDGFTDNVMAAIAIADPRPEERSGAKAVSYRSPVRNQFIHCMIACVATYMFVSSGFLQSLMNLDGDRFQEQVQSQAADVVQGISETMVRLFGGV